MSYAIDIAETYDYKEININLGCPVCQQTSTIEKNEIYRRMHVCNTQSK